MTNTDYPFAQNNAAPNDAGAGRGISFQHVKTKTINVGGTDFYHSKPGENNPGQQSWRCILIS